MKKPALWALWFLPLGVIGWLSTHPEYSTDVDFVGLVLGTVLVAGLSWVELRVWFRRQR